MMQIGLFRRNVMKTVQAKATKLALRTATKSTPRVQAAQATVALTVHTGQLLQALSQYVLGAQQTQEMKDHAFHTMGDIGADLAILCRVLKVNMPSSTKKVKLVGTRAAALLQLDSLSTDLLRQVERGLFVSPTMTTVKKMVSMPQKGGAKEERDVEIVNAEAETAAETDRQAEMKSFLSGAVDVFWRLNFDLFGQPPAAVLDAKFKRLQAQYPEITFDTGDTPKAPKAKAKKAPAKPKKQAEEPVPA